MVRPVSLVREPATSSRSNVSSAVRGRGRAVEPARICEGDRRRLGEIRDAGLADAMYDAVMQAIPTDAPALPEESTTAAAVTFRALVPDLAALSDAERGLLSEWLDRVSGS